GRLRQRDGGELRRLAEDRADRRPLLALAIAARAGRGGIHLLVQQRPPARVARRHPARRVRSSLRLQGAFNFALKMNRKPIKKVSVEPGLAQSAWQLPMVS